MDLGLQRSISFEKAIVVHNLSFGYGNDQSTLFEKFSISINKGDFVGLKGKTGRGKSTLLLILMGLLRSSEGSVLIDDNELSPIYMRSWQNKLAVVPQKVFLFDATIAENIAFGSTKGKIDYGALNEAARMAHLCDDIANFPKGFDTEVGENGARLSGGQAQRIGIARALYSGKPVLILDEATSALDERTAAAIMRNLKNLRGKKTIIMISHNNTYLRECNLIIDLDNEDRSS